MSQNILRKKIEHIKILDSKPWTEGLLREAYLSACYQQTALCLVMKSRKLHPDEKRIYEVKVRLNLKEKQKLDGIIRISNVHAPDVFRMLLMKGKLPDAAVPVLDIQTYYELRKLAANYNQYVKAIHQSRITNIDWEIAKQLTDVLEIIRNKIRKS